MTTPDYKYYQQLYNSVVVDHPDDFAKMEVVMSDELVENALRYFKEATFPLYYPAKSYAVAIIYARVLNDIYGIDEYDILSDRDLFLGQDPHFVPYQDDPETYDAILERLKHIPNWLSSGWAPKSAEYCYLECTEDGLVKTMESLRD